jgi:predicted ATPase
LRKVWAAYEGVEVKTVGDSFLVAFDSAADALAAAVAAQQAIAAHQWPEEAAIRVRIGVHTGMAFPHEGDYIALALHQASRVVAAANGGFVLASDEAVVAAGETAQVTIDRVGSFRLRDFEQPVTLSAVGPRGTRLPHPVPVRAVPAHGHNLVAPATTFVGRDDAISELAGRVGAGRLLTIVGPGGMGKTRLAVELGLRVAREWADGVWIADLSKATNGRLVAAAVADAIGVSGGDRDDRSVVLEHLSEWSALLILDSCERVPLAAARLATELLAGCPGVGILATSRRPLALGNEDVWRIGPLPTSDDSVRLFVDRASAQLPDIAANPSDERIVGEICRHLDGMPLAIELAAARLTVLSPPEILDGLRQRFQLLRGRDPSAPARQRTMQGLLDWDYELLSDAEQAALARLSVFSGSVNLRAASAAVGHSGLDAADVPDLVWSLSDCSLVQVERSAGDTRYRLLETVRAYAAEKLRTSGDGAATRRALAQHYLDRFPPAMRGQREWINGVALEADTMVDLVALLVSESPDEAYGLAWIVSDHRSATGRNELARREASSLVAGDILRLPSLARLLSRIAGLHANAGALEEADELIERAVSILDTVGTEDRWGTVSVTGGITTIALYRRDRASLLDATRRVEEELQQTSDVTARADALWWLSMLRNALEEGDEIALATEAIELSRQTGDYVALVGSLCAAAEYTIRVNDDLAAATYQREALRLSAELGIDIYTAFAFIIAARLAHDRKQVDTAVLLHASADVILERIGFTLMPDDRQLSNEMLANAWSELGETRYVALETEGRTLSLDRGVALADEVFNEVAPPG